MLVSLGNCVTLQAPIGSDFHGGDWMPACVSLFPVGLLSGHGWLHISPAQTQDAGTASKYQRRFVERCFMYESCAECRRDRLSIGA